MKPLILIFALALWNGEKVVHSEREWIQLLGIERFAVMRQKQTEPAHSGLAYIEDGDAIFLCAGCDLPLFAGKNFIPVGNGWPNFTKPVVKNHVYYLEDWRLSFKRYEVLCSRCDSHLGHLFHDGPPPKNFRYCINSLSLKQGNSHATQKRIK